MDYKEMARDAKIMAESFRQDGNVILPNRLEMHATAITDLLARAEAAEAHCARLEEARENANEACAKWEMLCHMAEQERDTYKAALQNWYEEG